MGVGRCVRFNHRVDSVASLTAPDSTSPEIVSTRAGRGGPLRWTFLSSPSATAQWSEISPASPGMIATRGCVETCAAVRRAGCGERSWGGQSPARTGSQGCRELWGSLCNSPPDVPRSVERDSGDLLSQVEATPTRTIGDTSAEKLVGSVVFRFGRASILVKDSRNDRHQPALPTICRSQPSARSWPNPRYSVRHRSKESWSRRASVVSPVSSSAHITALATGLGRQSRSVSE